MPGLFVNAECFFVFRGYPDSGLSSGGQAANPRGEPWRLTRWLVRVEERGHHLARGVPYTWQGRRTPFLFLSKASFGPDLSAPGGAGLCPDAVVFM